MELLKWLSRCLLTIGGRSIGHLYSYLDRHDPIMLGLIQTTGDEVSRTAVSGQQAACIQLTMSHLALRSVGAR